MRKKAGHRRHTMLAALLLAGCQSIPEMTRTGAVTEIVITEELSRSDVIAAPDDEVRWINKRTAPVRIILLESVDGKLSCKHGFGRFMELTESATLHPNENASVCVNQPGAIRYAVIGQAVGPSKEVRLSGLIRIAPR